MYKLKKFASLLFSSSSSRISPLALFIWAVHIPLQAKINSGPITAAELMLDEFYNSVPELYAEVRYL